MGLLSAMGAPAPAPQGGLLGAFAGQPQQPQQAGNPGLQMAMQLSQSPTPQVAQQIIARLHQMGNPEAAQFEQMIGKVVNDPGALKQLADAVVQKLQGAQ